MKFRIEDDNLSIRFEGAEQFWALKRKLSLTKTNIVRAVWEEYTAIPRTELGWRLGGASLPGLLYAGRFAGNEGLNFVYIQRPKWAGRTVSLQNILTLELRHSHYRRFIFSITDPDIAGQIIAWWSGNS